MSRNARFRDNPGQFGVLRCRCGKRAWSSERAVVKALALAQSRRVGQEERGYECNVVPGTWHMTSAGVEDAPRFVLPPSPRCGGGQPLLDVITDLLIDAIQEQGPGLLMPSLSVLRKYFVLSSPQIGTLKYRLVQAQWIRTYETSSGLFTRWPRQYAEERGPRVGPQL